MGDRKLTRSASGTVLSEIPNLRIGQPFPLNEDVSGVKLEVEWFSPHSGLADLDVYVLLYDENARFIEKLNIDRCTSSDGSVRLEADMDLLQDAKTHKECVHICFPLVSVKTTAMVLFVDGGPRNFQYISSVTLTCAERDETTAESSQDLVKQLESSMNAGRSGLFRSECSVKSDFQGVAALVVYKDGWHEDDSPKFVCCPTLEPVYLSTTREKDEYCQSVAVDTVPCLLKYRTRLFPSVKSICAALSSTALPRLKKRFSAGKGLPLAAFTEVLFQQLYHSQPQLLDRTEAAYTVAMLHEMFGQIDFNGDGAVDWDEFTTFCIHTGLIGSHENGGGGGRDSGGGGENDADVGDALNSYVVEYREDLSVKDMVLSTHSPLAVLHHAPLIRRLLVLQDKREACLLMDERFNLISTLNPSKVLGLDETEERFRVYDMCYIPPKDMYCLVASDHSITVYREHMAQSGTKCSYSVYARMHHTFLQVRVIYSALTNLLCTVDCNNNIYGWALDGKEPVFEVSRHKALVTDLLSIDNHNLFATCSLDKRVVLWSQTTRRVKGVLLGHRRGITRMSFARDTLLTSGFECEARTWDLNLKEPQLILRGHRLPIIDGKVMCADTTLDRDMRAITVDDGGEFRLWSIGVSEMNDSNSAETLQIFSVNAGDNMNKKFSCLFLPFDPRSSNSNYSNIIAGSSKLVHFKPEKNTKEFLPPNCMLYSDINACLMTAVGKSIFKYDVFQGGFQNSFENICSAEITCFANDGKEGRRLFLGFADGTVILMNFASGQILCRERAHAKGVASLMVRNDPSGLVLYAGSSDGRLRTLVEHGGNLVSHSSLDDTFRDDRSAITHICVAPEVKLLLMAASSTNWGGWNCYTLKKYFCVAEVEPLTGLEIIGGGGFYDRGKMVDYESSMEMEYQKVVTVAVCTSTVVRIYSIDALNVKAVCTHKLMHTVGKERLYFSNMVTLQYPQHVSMNYSGKLSETLKEMVVVSSDEGWLVAWDIRSVRDESISTFYDTYPHLLAMAHMLIPQAHQPPRTTKSDGLLSSEDEESGKRLAVHGLESMPEFLKQSADEGTARDDFEDYDDDCFHEEDGDSVSSEQTLESQASLFSMTSKMGVVVDTLGQGAHAVGVAKTVTLGPPPEACSPLSNNSRSPSPDKPASFSPLIARPPQRHHLHRMHTMATAKASGDDVLPPLEESCTVQSAFSWRCHTDSIQSMVVLREDACILTNSLDGFHRVWNLHQECLGELALPNLTESMQLQQKESRQAWKFILEKIPVLPRHERIADGLTAAIIADKNQSQEEKGLAKRRRAGLESQDLKQQRALQGLSRRDKQRQSLLSNLVSGSFHSFGNEIMNNLNEKDEPMPGSGGTMGTGSVEEVGRGKTNTGVIATDEEESVDSSRGSSVQFSTTTKTNDGGITDPSKTRKFVQKMGSMSTLQTSKKLVSARAKQPRLKTKSAADVKFASTFGSEQLWNDPSEFVANNVTAFSETSIANAHHQGYIDEEAHAILRRLQKDTDKLDVYRRSQPQLMLKNVGMCTSIEYPSSNMNNAELSFGKQQHMYKHANTVISERTKMSDRAKQNARHALAHARIKNAAGGVGKLVEFTKPTVHSITLPSLPVNDPDCPKSPPVLHALEASRQGQRRVAVMGQLSSSVSLSSLESPAGPPPKKTLDRIKISQYMGKIMDAEDGAVTQWEKDVAMRQRHEKSDRISKRKRKAKQRPAEKRHTMVSIERRLGTTIKHFFAQRGELDDDEKDARIPTVKDLLPSYTIADVRNFLETFQRVDVDMSGTLDVNEWVEFLSGENNKTISKHQARTLFTNVDMSSQGVLTIKDLVPIVFSKADKATHELIANYLDEQVAKTGLKGRDGVTTLEIEALFECYDSEHIGYITVRLLREKVKGLRLPLTAHASVTQSFSDFEDDELINISEFIRVFHTFICNL